ncbi:HBS1-like protein isoform X2 [Scyliorhinus canicula]|uniref:HBS1-like protein isoform X2 n=1 Tax=Scyliorhinus canicula TaxID=7830 RepID=UPI0018F63F41|nr:HBS1-like protein isoform X2 [Scyliorhinus canicula]
MARHRNVRGLKYDEDFEDDDVYGQSVEDDYCISPTTAAQFIYKRDDYNQRAFAEEPLEEGDEYAEDKVEEPSHNNQPIPSGVDQARLHYCLDEIREVLGDSVSEQVLVDAVLNSQYDAHKALDLVLSEDSQQISKVKTQSTAPALKSTIGDIFYSSKLVTSKHTDSCLPVTLLDNTDNFSTFDLSILLSTKPELSCASAPMAACESINNESANEGEETSAQCISLLEMIKETPNVVQTNMKTLNGLLADQAAESSHGGINLADLIKNCTGKAREQSARVDADIVPKVAKMTVSGKQITGFNIPSTNVDENDHLRKGTFAEETYPSPLPEVSSKPNSTAHVASLTEEAAVVQTFSKGSAKARQQIDVKAELEKRQGGKQLLNLVVIGHVDAGKSTLMGHLLYLLGKVNKRIMHKYEQESKKAGKASFAFAWVLDETGEERERGVTMDVGMTTFETKTKLITLMDAPGHKDFIPNMITGAAQADVAILVVDASRGEFEAGFEAGGQTREHALLVRSLGVTQLAVAVNKMDQVNWQPERFKEISNKLGHFLKQAGFKDSDVAYIPTAGLNGENLITRSQVPELKVWYNGPSLLEQIDSFKSPQRPVEKPFRLCVADVFKDQGSGFSVTGKIEAGYVQTGDRVLVMPPNETCIVKGITLHDVPLDWAAAGDHVTLTVTGVDIIKINVGCIFCDQKAPIKTCTRFRARVLIFSIDIPITQGLPVLLHYQTLSEPCTIRRLVSVLHKNTGEVLKKKPKCLTKGQNALIELQTQRPVSLELYKDFKELGRFMLRYSGSSIAAGVVTEIKE